MTSYAREEADNQHYVQIYGHVMIARSGCGAAIVGDPGSLGKNQ